MQDDYRILGSGKSGKMAKRYQHHKFPPCLGNPSIGERTRRILHTFSDITIECSIFAVVEEVKRMKCENIVFINRCLALFIVFY